MENRPEFLEVVGENGSTSEFLLLYQQSALFALREQGVLDEGQYEFCLDALGKKEQKKGGET